MKKIERTAEERKRARAEAVRRWAERNPEKAKESARIRAAKYAAKNREKLAANARKHASKPEVKEAKKEYMKKWRAENANTLKAAQAERWERMVATETSEERVVRLERTRKACAKHYAANAEELRKRARVAQAEKMADTAYAVAFNKKNAVQARDYYARNREVVCAKLKADRIDQERNLELNARTNKWRLENKEKVRAMANKLYRENHAHRCAVLLRARTRHFLKGRSEGGRTAKLLGCSFEQLREHLEGQFTQAMRWDNAGVKGWHIDHIIPFAAIDTADAFQLSVVCHYSNLRPLWWDENQRKSGKITQEARERMVAAGLPAPDDAACKP